MELPYTGHQGHLEESVMVAPRGEKTTPRDRKQTSRIQKINQRSSVLEGGPCGENLYLSSAKDTWTEAIKDWMSEGDDFTYDEGGNGNMVGHYTQVVWAETNQVGCARAKCDNLQFPYLYVCHYCPAGNNWKRMARPYEAGEPCSKCKGACQNNLCV
ncbi:allurin-like [Eleutherodactylus coqui]|uniref:allurin-like n=1 Tax=Eleutherodactylus coqui TaxID=57060 RepID=UPI00346323CA